MKMNAQSSASILEQVKPISFVPAPTCPLKGYEFLEIVRMICRFYSENEGNVSGYYIIESLCLGVHIETVINNDDERMVVFRLSGTIHEYTEDFHVHVDRKILQMNPDDLFIDSPDKTLLPSFLEPLSQEELMRN